MAIVTVGIDLAKNVFAVHGVDETGKPVLVRPAVKRAALPELIAKLPPCLIGMEECSGAHHWAREFAKFGHTPRKAVMLGKLPPPGGRAMQANGRHAAIHRRVKTNCADAKNLRNR